MVLLLEPSRPALLRGKEEGPEASSGETGDGIGW